MKTGKLRESAASFAWCSAMLSPTPCSGLRVENDDLDIHAGRKHSRQRLKTDVVHRAVAADDPQALLLPALRIPPRAHAHRDGGRIFKEGIGPGDLIRIVWIR